MPYAVKDNRKDWDPYWQNAASRSFYSLAAHFYRRYLIGRQLRHFAKKYFSEPRGALLHAGCGSGEVDRSIRDLYQPVSLDLSLEALRLNTQISGNHRSLCCGDIFKLPFLDRSLEGIYNLGVMEHFYEAEISQILSEFRRCLKDQGILMLFWPPEFGVSVRFLGGLSFLLNTVFRRQVRFHPDEVTRLRSKKHSEEILERSGFRLVEYYFGPLDFFTQVVLVAEKR